MQIPKESKSKTNFKSLDYYIYCFNFQVIKSHVNSSDSLMVADPKLGAAIKEKFNISCVSSSSAADLLRCIRSQFENLLVGLPKKDLTAMSLGLAHR